MEIYLKNKLDLILSVLDGCIVTGCSTTALHGKQIMSRILEDYGITIEQLKALPEDADIPVYIKTQSIPEKCLVAQLMYAVTGTTQIPVTDISDTIASVMHTLEVIELEFRWRILQPRLKLRMEQAYKMFIKHNMLTPTDFNPQSTEDTERLMVHLLNLAGDSVMTAKKPAEVH